MPYLDSSRFDALVAGFYRAATGEATWAQALQPVQQAFGARIAVLHTMDMANHGRLAALSYGEGESWAPEAVLHYVRDWHLSDPRRNRFLAEGEAALGRWRYCHEVFDEAFAQQHPFFRDYLAAYSSRYNANVVLPVQDGIVSALALELPRERGPLDAGEQADAERLGRHLQDALRAHERVRRLAVRALAGHGLLEEFTFPIWLIDPDRYVWHANAAAHAAQQAGLQVALHGNRLVACRDKADRALAEALHQLPSRGHGARARVDVRRDAADGPTLLLLHGVVPEQALGAFGDRPMVMATLIDNRMMRALDPMALCEVFALTPAQARVASLLADGHSAPEIASSLGCALSTVRSHLREVLHKLGARRLTDAVRLLRQGDLLWAGAAATR